MTVQAIEADSEFVCGWTSEVCCSKLAEALASVDPDVVVVAQRSVTTAAEVLYALSGRRFGACELTVRPCRPECRSGYPDAGGYPWTPVLEGGQWMNVSCRRCGDGCSCTRVCEVRLPGPIRAVSEVKVDGAILAPTDYRVDNSGQSLVRLGESCWPTCQNMTAADTEPGTWSVTYTRGLPLPEGGKAAFADLACELYKACADDDSSCKLPKRVVSIAREGVSFALLDPMVFLKEGKTGLYLVDLWLSSVNPQAKTRPSGIYSPDMPAMRRPGS